MITKLSPSPYANFYRVLSKLFYALIITAQITLTHNASAAQSLPLADCIRAAEAEIAKRDPSATNLATFMLRDSLGNASTAKDAVRNAKNTFRVYNLQGDLCFQSHRRIKAGDIIHTGVYALSSELEEGSRVVINCEAETSDINIIDTFDIGVFGSSASSLGLEAVPGSDPPGIAWFTPQECFGDEVRFEMRHKDDASDVLFGKTLPQYKRFRGTFQLGTVWTELTDRQFSRVTIGGEETIQSDMSPGRGPLYVGSLVVYGLPHYLAAIESDNARYAGRDIVNEHDWMDALGLVISIGLDDPRKTFGVGIAYEFVTGVSLTLSYLSREVTELNGLSIGDAYPASFGAIPTQDLWKSETVLGLSIDGRYLAKFFGS